MKSFHRDAWNTLRCEGSPSKGTIRADGSRLSICQCLFELRLKHLLLRFVVDLANASLFDPALGKIFRGNLALMILSTRYRPSSLSRTFFKSPFLEPAHEDEI